MTVSEAEAIEEISSTHTSTMLEHGLAPIADTKPRLSLISWVHGRASTIKDQVLPFQLMLQTTKERLHLLLQNMGTIPNKTMEEVNQNQSQSQHQRKRVTYGPNQQVSTITIILATMLRSTKQSTTKPRDSMMPESNICTPCIDFTNWPISITKNTT